MVDVCLSYVENFNLFFFFYEVCQLSLSKCPKIFVHYLIEIEILKNLFLKNKNLRENDMRLFFRKII